MARFLDAAAMLKVVRQIAQKHIDIRLAQTDVYLKTSSVAKSLRSQPQPQLFSYAGAPHDARPFSQSHRSTAKSGTNPSTSAQELNQDSHYVPPKEQAPPTGSHSDLQVDQQDAARYPLPDGTIPPEHGQFTSDSADPESFSQVDDTELPKRPLENNDRSTEKSMDINGSSIPNIPAPKSAKSQRLSSHEKKVLQRQSEDQIPAQPAKPPGREAYHVKPVADDVAEFGVAQEQDVFYQPPDSTAPVLSALPRIRVPMVEWDIQGGDSHIPNGLNADVYYSGTSSMSEPSEEMMSQIFHNPKIARLLGGAKNPSQSFARAYHTGSRLHQNQGQRERDELETLAKDIASDAQSPQPVSPSFMQYKLQLLIN